MMTVKAPKKARGFSGIQWKQVSGGEHHTVALDNEGIHIENVFFLAIVTFSPGKLTGKVYTLGRGSDGRLGLGSDAPESLSLAIPVPGLQNLKCVQVAAGLSTAYALTDDGRLFAWGFGENYQLGTGKKEDLLEPQILTKMSDKRQLRALADPVLYVAGGAQHVAAIVDIDMQE